jgi:hypothetical protein
LKTIISNFQNSIENFQIRTFSAFYKLEIAYSKLH